VLPKSKNLASMSTYLQVEKPFEIGETVNLGAVKLSKHNELSLSFPIMEGEERVQPGETLLVLRCKFN
jgi:hypothetical protein